MEHLFTAKIKLILRQHFGESGIEIFAKSPLIQYINEKTRSAEKGSKSRSSFANLYAIYVIIEDYITNGYQQQGDYSLYEGASFVKLLARQRQLPFGNKLQNHALNNRVNSEFEKYFPTLDITPILRDHETNRYWINEQLLKIKIDKTIFTISGTIIEIIDEYIKTKQDNFYNFVKSCEELQSINKGNPERAEKFIVDLLSPNVDARLFEIVSFAILKIYYYDQIIIWGFAIDRLNKENLKLYKTGRTNANDGGIDFVMKPLGRFFQVTETLDFKKYFLDIDKIQKYPITFVVKSSESIDDIFIKIRKNAEKSYLVKAIVGRYMSCIEEIINISALINRFKEAVNRGQLDKVLDEIVFQSKVEFNYENINESELDK